MTVESLTEEEKNILYKCILRCHKENGTINKFKKHYVYRKSIIFEKALKRSSLHEFLIGPLWSIFKTKEGINSGILASIKQIEFIDVLRSTKIPTFMELCYDIATSEINYINGIIPHLNYYDKGDLKEKINSVWEKYKCFCKLPINNLNLPIK